MLLQFAMLMDKWRHSRPVVIDVRGPVSSQNVLVLWREDQRIADFNGIAVAWGQLREKHIETGKNVDGINPVR